MSIGRLVVILDDVDIDETGLYIRPSLLLRKLLNQIHSLRRHRVHVSLNQALGSIGLLLGQ